MKPKSRKLQIYGKTRIIRDIRFDTPTDFEAYYKDYFIHVQKEKYIYAWCSAPDGCYIVDGYIDDKKNKRCNH